MLALVILLGWIVGGFINYISDVLPYKRRLTAPFCIHCEQPQPLVNYFVWPRKCPHCGHHRTYRTWMVELLTTLIVVWLWLQPDLVLGFWFSLVLLAYFSIVVVIDLEHHLIMHPTSIFGAVLGLVLGIQLHGFIDTLMGGLAGFGAMLGLYILGALFARFIVRRSQSGFNDEALGFGDVILGGILGLILGWPAIIAGLFFAILFAGVISLIYLVISFLARKYRAFTFIPYGPFMIAGAAALIFFNQYFINAFGG
ncbi:MAG: prepilin peptidase [Anaerolineales bacterium]|jgi:prepilin signal peptidase PulO-like enzyme (type II secretory pathway)